MAWAAVAAWTFVVLGLSGDDFSAASTSGFLKPLLQWLFPFLGEAGLETLHFAVRKSAHASEYGVLGLLACWAWIASGVTRPGRVAWAGLAWVATVACIDETRQSFSPVREGSPLDVLLDVTGGAVAVGLALAVRARLTRPPFPNSGDFHG